MIKIYGASASPFVRKVLPALEYKSVAYEQIPVTPFAPPDGWASTSPMKRIPVLVEGDLTLPDSTIICRYIFRARQALPLFTAPAAAEAEQTKSLLG